MRARRGRSLLDRLRQAGKPAGAEAEQPPAARAGELANDAYDFLEGYGRGEARPVSAVPQGPADFLSDGAVDGVSSSEEPFAPRSPSYPERAVEVFNAQRVPASHRRRGALARARPS